MRLKGLGVEMRFSIFNASQYFPEVQFWSNLARPHCCDAQNGNFDEQ